MTPKQVARQLGCSPNTVYIKCKRGEIKHKKIGGQVCIYSEQFIYPETDEEKSEKIIDFIFNQSGTATPNTRVLDDIKKAMMGIAENANLVLNAIEKINA